MKCSTLFNPATAWKMVMSNRQLILQLVKRQIATRYKGSALGYFWSLTQPLVMLVVYTFVFGVVFKTRWGLETNDSTGSFAVIMFCGMAVFNIFTESVNNSATTIVNNANYVKKVIFPLEILPLVQLVSTAVLGMIWFVLVVVGALALRIPFSWTVLWLPVVLGPLLLCSLGVSYFVASATVFLRDLPHLVGILTQMLFFMTPIFYPASLVPPSMAWVLHINPLTSIVTQTREVLLFGRQPDWVVCGIIWVVTWAIFQLGFAWFLKTKKGFADVL